jgi:hypothetical protein
MIVICTHAPPPRRSFTLVELLITMSVVTILAITIVTAMAGALEHARVERARAQVTKINELLVRRWEEYRTRPVRIIIPPGSSGIAAARMRLNALRETMRMEMPDRISDLRTPPASGIPVPSLAQAYLRRAPASWQTTDPNAIKNQSAECLYLILALMREGDGTALDNFKPSEIGDVDGDGMFEVLDPWGQPIHFLRWAPNLQSPLQILNKNSPNFVPDPFDPFRAGWANPNMPNPALYPFVFSGGPDETPGYNENPTYQYPTSGPLPSNPYANNVIGTPGPAANDDIHSHLLE